MKLKNWIVCATLAVCVLASPAAFAQTGMVTVSASHLVDSTGTAITNATISFAPENSLGQPISYRIDGSGQAISRAVTAQVTSGAFTISLADTSLTEPVNVCYSVTVTDNTSGDSLLGAGYSCVQPAYSNSWCTTGACDFDNYTPSGTAGSPVVAPTLAIGAVNTLPPGASATGSVSGAAPNFELNLGIPTGATGAVPTIELGTVTTLSAGSTPTVDIIGTNPYSVNFGIPATGTAEAGGTNGQIQVNNSGQLGGASAVQFSPQMFDSENNIVLDPSRTTPIYGGSGTSPAAGNTIVGTSSGLTLGNGWSNSGVTGVASSNQFFGNDIALYSIVGADNVGIGTGCLANFLGYVVGPAANDGDPSDGNNTCVGSDADYDLPWAFEEIDLGQKVHQDTNFSVTPATTGWEGFSSDSFVEGIHGDGLDRVINSTVEGAGIGRDGAAPLDITSSTIIGDANQECLSASVCPVAGLIMQDADDVIDNPGGGNDEDLTGFTSLGYGAGSSATPSAASGSVAAVGISAGGTYVGGCPTITFSAPVSGGTTATGTVNCAYSFPTNTYSVAYISGLPSGGGNGYSTYGYDQFTFISSTSGSPTITVTSDTGLAVGETLYAYGIPAGDTVTAISGTTVTLEADATITQTSMRAVFGTPPTVTMTCSSPCTSGAGFSGSAFLTGAGTNYSTYLGYNAGLKASSLGGVNTVVGSESVQNVASVVSSFGYNNASADTGDSYDEFFGQSNTDSGGTQTAMVGYDITCPGCNQDLFVGNSILAPASAVSDALIFMPKANLRPLCSDCWQFDNRIVLDNSGNINADMLVTSVGASAIASATTIAPSAYLTHISGTTVIETITPPTVFSGALTAVPFTGCLHLIPDGAWSLGTTGNVAISATATVDQVMTVCYDGTKWYPN